MTRQGAAVIPFSGRRRVANLTGGEECATCRDDAIVTVGSERRAAGADRAYFVDVLGPCPNCERGLRLEFPNDGAGPWGKDGYWRGREIPDRLRP